MQIKVIVKNLRETTPKDIEDSINTYLKHKGGTLISIEVDDGKMYIIIEKE